MTEKVKALLV